MWFRLLIGHMCEVGMGDMPVYMCVRSHSKRIERMYTTAHTQCHSQTGACSEKAGRTDRHTPPMSLAYSVRFRKVNDTYM